MIEPIDTGTTRGEITVLNLMGALKPSGMERMLVSAREAISKEKLEMLVVGQGDIHPYRDEISRAGYRTSAIRSIRSLGGVRDLIRQLKLARPDVLHIHTESAFSIAILAARIYDRNLPIVRTIHSIFPVSGRASWSRRIQSVVFDRYVSHFIAPSEEVAKTERKIGRRALVIYNWVDSRFVHAPAVRRDPMFAVIVGNCAPVKRHEVALSALRDHGYIVAHFGSEAGASFNEKALLDDIYASGKLRHRGVGDPLEAIQSAGVFVLPSEKEGMSVALAEAVSAGAPALVANSPGLDWAREIAGVEMIDSTDAQAWHRALPLGGYSVVAGSKQLPDFSAARGAREYAELYRDSIDPHSNR